VLSVIEFVSFVRVLYLFNILMQPLQKGATLCYLD
jgi:hypothetical protein